MRESTGQRRRVLELDKREQGPVEVTLLWDRETSGAVVVVWNWASGACLQLDVEADCAGYAFTHPYAYAGAHGVPQDDILQVA
ncbi:hypothetical protein ACI79J_08530 [Geodermatophilus sp. SYSU D01062]